MSRPARSPRRLASGFAGAVTVALLPLALISPVAGATAAPAAVEPEREVVSAEVQDLAAGRDRVRVIATFAPDGPTSKTPSRAAIRSARADVLDAIDPVDHEVVSTYARIPAVSLEVTPAGLADLAAAPGVQAVQEDHVVEVSMAEANEFTGVNDAHALGTTGEGITVAIIDTGIDSAAGVVHPALADDLVGQRCFRTENDCIGGPTSAEDQDAHGTHVAGIITGPNGAAPDATFHALKVFTTGNTSDTNILNALDHVIALNAAEAGAVDLVNMSLGGNNYATQSGCNAANPAYRDAFAALNAQGTAVFVATGNDAQIDEVGAPGCVDGAIGVGSTGDAAHTLTFSNCVDNGAVDKVSCFSNATPVQGDGELVDLLAPGCYIVSTGLNGSTNTPMCGTSMATPFAAGVAALALQNLRAAGVDDSPAALEELLESTGTPVSDYRISGGPVFPRVDATGVLAASGLVPTGLQVTGTTATSVSLQWDATPAAVSYRVRRGPDVDGAFSAPETVSVTSFTDAGAECGPLSYSIQAVNGVGGSSPWSAPVTGTARACPAAPSAVTLTRVDAETQQLTWTLPSDPGGGRTGVLVQRRLGDAGTWVDHATLAATATSTEDTHAVCEVVRYRIVALAGADRSTPSDVVRRTMCAPDNDDLSSAAVIPGSGAAPYSLTVTETQRATVEPGDPQLNCIAGTSPGTHSLWWTFTPTRSGQLTLDTLGSTGAHADTVLAVFTGDPDSLVGVACNDDRPVTGLSSLLSGVPVLAGTTYSILVTRYPGMSAVPAQGTVQLQADFQAGAGVSPSVASLAVEEGVGSADYTVEVSGTPTAPVTVEVAAGSQCAVSPSTLTFSAAEVGVAKTVTVTAPDDDVTEAEHSCVLSHTTSSSDTDFAGLEVADVTVTVADALRTGIDVLSPAEGATLTRGATLVADYACTDNRGGAGILSCVGPVADGATIDTGTVGAASFTVTLTDVHGRTSTLTRNYQVTAPVDPPVVPPVGAPAVGRPDVRIQVGTAAAKGDGIYGGASAQSVKAKGKVKKATFTVTVQNDATAADAMVLRGVRAPRGFTVRYLSPSGQNITAAVLAGTFRTPSLAPGATYVVKVVVKAKKVKKAKKKLKGTLTATSVRTPGRADTVGYVARRR